MTKLYLSLLGGFDVAVNGTQVGSFESDKVRALLAFLAVEARVAHRRESLCGLLWPDKPERLARRSLSQSLYNLQSNILNQSSSPPFLLINQPDIQFNHASDQRVDVLEFSELLIGCHQHHDPQLKNCKTCTERLQRAVHLYTGDLLKGFSMSDSSIFEEWLMLKREQLNRRCVNALQQLIHIHQTNHELTETIYYARRWVELEPFQEDAHYLLLQQLALAGHRSEALAQFEYCQTILWEDLGVEPSAKTVQLYREIRTGTMKVDAAEVRRFVTNANSANLSLPAKVTLVAESTYLHESFPLLARNRELTQLRNFLSTTLRGQGQLVFVSGEAGSGKTALLESFARWAQDQHEEIIVVGGVCNALNGIGDTYLPFRDILALLTGELDYVRETRARFGINDTRLADLFPSTLQALLEVGPDLLDSLVPIQPLLKRVAKLPGGAEWQILLQILLAERAMINRPIAIEQDVLFTQFTKVLERLAQVHPLLLLLDNLQWADSSSIGLLFHLGMRMRDLPILIVGAYRPSEIVINHEHWVHGHEVHGHGGTVERPSLVTVVDEFKRQLGNIEVQLSREGDRGFVDTLLDLMPNRFDATFRETLDRKTGGNPLFVIELVRAMQEQGDLIQNPEGYWLAKSTPNWEKLPTRVEATLNERLRLLPKSLRRLLTVASVEGEIFTVEVLAKVLAMDEQAIVQLLSNELTQHYRLVRALGVKQFERKIDYEIEHGETKQRVCFYTFRQSIFQQFLYKGIDEVERALLHEAIGNALESIHAAQKQLPRAVAAQLSHHFEQAQIPEKALYYQHVLDGKATTVINHNGVLEPTRAITPAPSHPLMIAGPPKRQIQNWLNLPLIYFILECFMAL